MFMKRFLLFLLTLLSLPCFAQLRAPVQTDTLYIKAVKYNYSEIRPENWPCTVIIKNTTSFTIAGETFEVESVRKGSYEPKYHCDEIIYTMKDGSRLFYYEGSDVRAVEYSGYEFICYRTKPEINPDTKPDSTSGTARGRLSGRDVLGNLPSPANPKHAEGVVVVDIWVDNHGNVQKAVAGGSGTTLTDAELWTAARAAALKAHFSMSPDAPALQQGTITYVFKM